MWSMTTMKQQKANDEFRGLYSLESFYTSSQVGIDKSCMAYTYELKFCNAVEYWFSCLGKVWDSKHLFWRVK
jgi:hypothetical protein